MCLATSQTPGGPFWGSRAAAGKRTLESLTSGEMEEAVRGGGILAVQRSTGGLESPGWTQGRPHGTVSAGASAEDGVFIS